MAERHTRRGAGDHAYPVPVGAAVGEGVHHALDLSPHALSVPCHVEGSGDTAHLGTQLRGCVASNVRKLPKRDSTPCAAASLTRGSSGSRTRRGNGSTSSFCPVGRVYATAKKASRKS